jgi:hypothetical protein
VTNKTAFVALGLCFLTYTTASLADWKVYNGAGCIKNDQPGDGSIARGAVNGIYADGGSFANVVCPIVRDRINSSTSLTDVYVEFSNLRGGDNFPVRCFLWTQTEDGNSGSFVDWDYDESTVQGRVQLYLSADTSSDNEGAAALDCTIWEDDHLYHYLVGESNSATD